MKEKFTPIIECLFFTFLFIDWNLVWKEIIIIGIIQKDDEDDIYNDV